MSLKVTLVNYINTYPFLDALLLHPKKYELDKKTPKECGQSFIDNNSDIALVPTGFLSELEMPYQLLGNYGIASHGPVRTVKLLADNTIDNIDSISIDNHSTTSSLLLKILCKYYWNISATFLPADMNNKPETDAALMIGDKVFQYEEQYEYQYDLGSAWNDFTGLPFIFALWLAKSDIENEKLVSFNKDLKHGLDNIDQTIYKYRKDLPGIDLDSYLKQNIKYTLSDDYLEGLKLFIDLASSLNPSAAPARP